MTLCVFNLKNLHIITLKKSNQKIAHKSNVVDIILLSCHENFILSDSWTKSYKHVTFTVYAKFDAEAVMDPFTHTSVKPINSLLSQLYLGEVALFGYILCCLLWGQSAFVHSSTGKVISQDTS